jgi:type I restriction enzyme, S subunit
LNPIRIDQYFPIDIEGLPRSWGVILLGDLIPDPTPGFPSGDHNRSGQGIPHLRPMNISRHGRLSLMTVKYVSAESPQRIKRGEILFNNTNSAELVGKTAIMDRDGEFAFSNHMTRLRIPTGISAKFIAHQLHFFWLSGFFLHKCVHHVNQASIPTRILTTVPLIIPPAEEQERVVSELEKQLSHLDAAGTFLDQAKKGLQRYRRALLRAAIEGRLAPTEAALARSEGREYEAIDKRLGKSGWLKLDLPPIEESPISLPEGWRLLRASQISEFVTKGTTPQVSHLFEKAGGIPFIKVHHLEFDGVLHFPGRPTFVDEAVHRSQLKRSIVRPGDVLMNIVGPPLGKVAIVPDSFPEWNINQAIARYRPLPGINSQFLMRVLQSGDILKWAMERAKTTAGQVNLTLEICRDLPLPIPPEPEQVRIVLEIDRRFSIIDRLEASIEDSLRRAHSLRQAILKSAFSGNLLPQDPSEESGSVLLGKICRSRAESATTNDRSRKGRGRPRASVLGSETKIQCERRRDGGSDPESSFALSKPLYELNGRSAKPWVSRPVPSEAQNTGGSAVPVLVSGDGAVGADRGDFLALSPGERVDEAWTALLGRGRIAKGEAVRTVAHYLREKGLAAFQRLRHGGRLYEAIAAGIERGVREGSFDRPKRGFIRALLADPRDYTGEEWRQCILESLDHETVPEREALRTAAEWARENMGLKFLRLREDGTILRGLRAALGDLLLEGKVKKTKDNVTRRPGA